MAVTHYPVDMETAAAIISEASSRFPQNKRLHLQNIFLFNMHDRGYITPTNHKITAWLVKDHSVNPTHLLRICYAKSKVGDVKAIVRFVDEELAYELHQIVLQKYNKLQEGGS